MCSEVGQRVAGHSSIMQDASSQLTAPQPQQLRDVQASLFHQDMMTADLLQALHGLGPSKGAVRYVRERLLTSCD